MANPHQVLIHLQGSPNTHHNQALLLQFTINLNLVNMLLNQPMVSYL